MFELMPARGGLPHPANTGLGKAKGRRCLRWPAHLRMAPRMVTTATAASGSHVAPARVLCQGDPVRTIDPDASHNGRGSAR